MLPGPQKAIYCPYCEQVLSYQTLSSGNTCGATRWSDGKQVAPMMPCRLTLQSARIAPNAFGSKPPRRAMIVNQRVIGLGP